MTATVSPGDSPGACPTGAHPSSFQVHQHFQQWLPAKSSVHGRACAQGPCPLSPHPAHGLAGRMCVLQALFRGAAPPHHEFLALLSIIANKEECRSHAVEAQPVERRLTAHASIPSLLHIAYPHISQSLTHKGMKSAWYLSARQMHTTQRCSLHRSRLMKHAQTQKNGPAPQQQPHQTRTVRSESRPHHLSAVKSTLCQLYLPLMQACMPNQSLSPHPALPSPAPSPRPCQAPQPSSETVPEESFKVPFACPAAHPLPPVATASRRLGPHRGQEAPLLLPPIQ